MLFRQMISVRTIRRFRFYLGVSFGLLALLLAVVMGLVVRAAAEEWPAVTPEQKAMTSIPINRTLPRSFFTTRTLPTTPRISIPQAREEGRSGYRYFPLTTWREQT